VYCRLQTNNQCGIHNRSLPTMLPFSARCPNSHSASSTGGDIMLDRPRPGNNALQVVLRNDERS
jgi:hypothetical protein